MPYKYFSAVFAKKYSTQSAIIVMTENTRKILDLKHLVLFLTDLSKAVDRMTHDLFMARLHTLNFDTNALNFIYGSLTGSKQRLKINSTFSSF